MGQRTTASSDGGGPVIPPPRPVTFGMDLSGDSSELLTACGAAAPAPGVIARVHKHLERETEIGGYDAADEAADELIDARRRVASLLGLQHGNVSFGESGTAATMALFQAISPAGPASTGNFIVTDPREFGPNHELLRRLAARSGAGVRLLGLTPQAGLDADQLEQLVGSGRVGLVWLSVAHAHAGSTNPVSGLVPALSDRPRETWVVLDACQSFGQMDDDLALLDPDAVIGTSRKWLRGPRGVGFAWVHPRRLDALDPWPGPSPAPLGVLERREAAVAAQLGFGAALAHLESVGVPATHSAIDERARWLRRELGDLPGWRSIDDPDTASGIVSLAPSGPTDAHTEAVGRAQHALAERGVRVTMTHRHHAPLAMDALGAGAALRLAPHADQLWDGLRSAVDALTTVTS